MNRAEEYNGGAFCSSARVAGNTAATAGGSGDNVEVNGAWIGRKGSAAAPRSVAMSAKLVINYSAALAENENVKFAVQFQDATTIGGGGAADYGDPALTTTVDMSETSGGSTETGTAEVDIDLSGAREFIRAQITPNLSRGATDTLAWSAVLIFFGEDRTPSSRAFASIDAPRFHN